jgi:hypothetical protein
VDRALAAEGWTVLHIWEHVGAVDAANEVIDALRASKQRQG